MSCWRCSKKNNPEQDGSCSWRGRTEITGGGVIPPVSLLHFAEWHYNRKISGSQSAGNFFVKTSCIFNLELSFF